MRPPFAVTDPVQLVQAHPEVARRIKLWIDIGADDGWLPALEAFHRQLQEAGIAHVWHVYPGGHDGEYWRAHTADYLRFYSAALYGATDASTLTSQHAGPMGD